MAGTKNNSGVKRSVKILWRLFLFGFLFVVLIIALANYGVLGKMPSIEELQNPSASLASQVFADDGSLMGKYYLEDRVVVVSPNEISPNVIHALVATEDERFYDHSGVDLRSLMRAVTSFGGDGGGSTITMQTAKNLFTEYSRNKIVRVVQKIKESIIAVKLERYFTKDEIITLYLNTVPFGDNVFGIRNAARTFFQKNPDQLDVQESAILIGMLKASTSYNPRLYPARALQRRNTVIDQMVRNKFLSADEAAKIKASPLQFNYKRLDETTGLAPYFRMVLAEEMKKWCKEHKKPDGTNYDLYRDGLKIYTTINPRMQLYAEEAVGKHISYMQQILNTQSDIKSGTVWKKHENVILNAMKNSDRWRNSEKDGMNDEDIKKSFYVKTPMKVFAWNQKRRIDTVMTPYDSIKYSKQMLQAGFMAMDPITGEVKAWVGGVDFRTYKYDHVNINTKRQVGSTIKPLLYSMAIDEGGFTPGTPVEDVQQNFTGYGNVPATSKTCSGSTIPMSEALAFSKNCATAYIMKQLGDGNESAKKFIAFLQKCGVTTKIEPYPSIALGSGEISLIEMIQAYSMFAGHGLTTQPLYITRIEDKNGNVLENRRPVRKQVISDLTASSMIDMMQNVLNYGTGKRIWSYNVSGEIAGKTGTTNDNSDAWFIGYSPQIVCGAWTGCDDRFIRFNSTSVGQGSSVALPIWAYFYSKASADPTLNIKTSVRFAKAYSSGSSVVNDWMKGVEDSTSVEGGENGDSTGIKAVPKNIAPQDIKPESDTTDVDDDAPATPVKSQGQQHDQPKAVMPEKKKGKGFLFGIFGKKDKNENSTNTNK